MIDMDEHFSSAGPTQSTLPGNTGSNMPQQYGLWNFSGALSAPYRFWATTISLRKRIASLNSGAVYKAPVATRGGVLAGDTGVLPSYGYLGRAGTAHRAPFRGVTFALTSIREPSQNVLAQWAANPEGYTGDVPSDLQPQVQNAPPWRRSAARGDSRQSFRSGIARGLRV